MPASTFQSVNFRKNACHTGVEAKDLHLVFIKNTQSYEKKQ